MARWSTSQVQFLLFSALLLVAALSPVRSSAHELRPIIATLVAGQGDRIDLIVSLNLEAAMAGIGPEHDDTDDSAAAPTYNRLRSLDPGALGTAFDSFAPTFAQSIVLSVDGTAVPLHVDRLQIPAVGDTDLPRISEVVLTGSLPSGAERFSWRLDRTLGDSVIRLRGSDSEDVLHSAYVRAGETGGPFPLGGLAPQSWAAIFVNYLEIGFVHIVPKGLDHILFVVGLFLLSTQLSSLLWQISAFTLAHTVTLALGVTGVITLPPAIVEPLIAASILYVAVENILTDRLHRWRTLLVFCFGLLHGLGFAGVLGEVGLSTAYFLTGLIAFNIGVELGQLAVLAACFAAVGWAMHRSWYRRAVVIPASSAIALIAGYWIVERVGLI